jgi:hypothetical protein
MFDLKDNVSGSNKSNIRYLLKSIIPKIGLDLNLALLIILSIAIKSFKVILKFLTFESYIIERIFTLFTY